MSVTTPDRALAHLYPPFARKIEVLLARMHVRTGVEWMIEEGLRFQARQDYLWTIGRRGRKGERPVTWTRETRWHGTGCAADLRPVAGYSCPREWWDWLYEEEQKLGLGDPPRKMGDLGHVQELSEAIREQGLAWVRGGFKPMPDTPTHTDPPPPTVPRVTLDGKPADIPAIQQGGHWYLQARELAAALSWPQPTWDATAQTLDLRTR